MQDADNDWTPCLQLIFEALEAEVCMPGRAEPIGLKQATLSAVVSGVPEVPAD